MNVLTLFGFLFLSCLFCAESMGQLPDSRGREFWLAFLPNYHNNRYSPSEEQRRADSLYIAIVAEGPCRGFIEWWDNTGQHWVERFQISDPRVPYVFARSWWGLELMGYNDSGVLLLTGSNEGGQGEKPVRQTFHIVVEEGGEVTVYAFQQALYTSEAFLVLPVDVLGTEYLILSYPSDGRLGSSGTLDEMSTPSQFAVIAVEDQTVVTIVPSAPTYRNGMREQRITLNRGEVYLVQARITPDNLRPDLTGTEVRATKPVAVLAGHQRAVVPVGASGLTSRDILIEQLPPTTAWGNSALVVHFPPPSDGLAPQGTHRCRVLAARPGTTLFLDGQPVAVLDRGQVYDFPLVQPVELQATGPILVATFHKTSNAGQVSRIGDPFMMLIPPVQQFLSRYRFLNVQKYLPRGGGGPAEPVYREQYATAVLPTTAELWLDGQRIDRSSYLTIGNSGYSYVWLPTTDGVHSIEARFPAGAPAPLGLYVYGYGPADSYGYIGGCSFRPLDISPPTVATFPACFAISGTVYDTAATDSRLRTVEVVQAENVSVTIEPFPKPSDSVRFQATLEDVFADGSFRLRAQDSSGYERHWDFSIPGFTVQIEPARVQLELLEDGQRHCRTFVLTNRGSFPQRLSTLRWEGDSLPQVTLTLAPLDSVIPPGGTARLELCFTASEKGGYRLYLVVGNECIADSMAALEVTIGADQVPPTVRRYQDSCGREVRLVVTDTVEPASGIASVEVLQQVNCILTVVEQELTRVIWHVRVDNPFDDAWYELRIRDYAGNERLFADTLPGFTLRVLQPAEGVVLMQPSVYGQLHCETVRLSNVGHFPIVLETVPLRQQTAFSVPPGQLPLRVLPGEERGLVVCFAPLQPQIGWYEDTLLLGSSCLAYTIRLLGQLLPQGYTGRDQCGLIIRAEPSAGPIPVRLSFPMPQPAATEVQLQCELSAQGPVSLALYNLNGQQVRLFVNTTLAAGKYVLALPVADLPSGLYWLRLQAGSVVLGQPLLITR